MLSLFGFAIGIGGLFGVTQGIEILLWSVALLFIAYWVASHARQRYFAHAFAATALAGLWNGLLHSLLFKIYVQNNLAQMEDIKVLPLPFLTAPSVFLLASVLLGLGFGIVAGGLAVLLVKLFEQRQPPVSSPRS
jgi:hypothetical protein